MTWKRLGTRAARLVVYASAVGAFLIVLLFLVSYVRYGRVIRKLEQGGLTHTTSVYAAPRWLEVGEEITAGDLIEDLKLAGYSIEREGDLALRIVAPVNGEALHIRLVEGRIASIQEAGGKTLEKATIEPPLLSNLSEQQRQQRYPVRFEQLPTHLVNAVVAVEDKRFFRHMGFDPFRMAMAAYVDLKEGRKQQGASTITMQLARSIWLGRQKKWGRKIEEMLLAMQMEAKLPKKKIFEYYANELYLGHRGPFSIHGFAAASRVLLNKKLDELRLEDAALLAGLGQAPSLYDPLRYPERARQRRNLVLALMRENEFITEEQRQQAAAAPIRTPNFNTYEVTAPYFVDYVMDELQRRHPRWEEEGEAARVYTTLDLRLQRLAEQAVELEMKALDKRFRGKDRPQVALVAIDPRTGGIKALVGGRDYRESQLNRARALRQPGSVFKPFVYAAAFGSGMNGGAALTPASTVLDEPTQFVFNRQVYEPGNFNEIFGGYVTLRRALASSLNVAAVKVAEMTGFEKVAGLARRVGLNVQPTPSIALGAYEATPVQITAAYVPFVNRGRYRSPKSVSMVLAWNNEVRYRGPDEDRTVMDPRVAYLMQSLLQDVVRRGTASGVRARGFKLPVGAKTGTSRDGWFAGFTTELVCVVWVGFDDGRELGLEGSKSALPVWTAFMKRAHELSPYRRAGKFDAPAGVTRGIIDPTTGLIANEFCPARSEELFLAGSEPGPCNRHSIETPAFPSVAAEAVLSPAPAAVLQPAVVTDPPR
ncbi:MAG: PBP1A family penicillin-binding protein [Bryobacteraceae bacterium]|nr:PBP1A family penicillin-binding protein [Bryobacteraceae bacterium]